MAHEEREASAVGSGNSDDVCSYLTASNTRAEVSCPMNWRCDIDHLAAPLAVFSSSDVLHPARLSLLGQFRYYVSM